MDFKIILSEFLKWRVKHLSDKRFIGILSILIGAVMGLVGSLLKFLVTIIEEEVREGILMEYLNYVYFLFPLFGIAIVIFYIQYFVCLALPLADLPLPGPRFHGQMGRRFHVIVAFPFLYAPC